MDKLKETEEFARFLQESGWDYGHCDDDAVVVVSLEYRKVNNSYRYCRKVNELFVLYTSL